MSNTIQELRLTKLVYKSLHHYRNLIIHCNEELAKNHEQYTEYEVLTYCRILGAIEFSKHTINLNYFDSNGKLIHTSDLLNLYEFMCEHRDTLPEDIDFINHLPLLNKFIADYGYSYESYESYKGDYALRLVYIKQDKGSVINSSPDLGLIKSRLEKLERDVTLTFMYQILHDISNEQIAEMLGLNDYRVGCITMLEGYEEGI